MSMSALAAAASPSMAWIRPRVYSASVSNGSISRARLRRSSAFPRFAASHVDFGPALERAGITAVDRECLVQLAGGRIEVAEREVITPGAGKRGRIGFVTRQIGLIFRGCLRVAVHLPERLGQPEPGRVEILVALERRSVMILERLGVVDFHPAVIFRQPEERPSIGRGVANPAADDLLGLAQPVGHQVKPGERLVDRRIRLDAGTDKAAPESALPRRIGRSARA